MVQQGTDAIVVSTIQDVKESSHVINESRTHNVNDSMELLEVMAPMASIGQ
jgi:methionine synthase I (cobalamin-dependent)